MRPCACAWATVIDRIGMPAETSGNESDRVLRSLRSPSLGVRGAQMPILLCMDGLRSSLHIAYAARSLTEGLHGLPQVEPLLATGRRVESDACACTG
jgi:hypothetical protein